MRRLSLLLALGMIAGAVSGTSAQNSKLINMSARANLANDEAHVGFIIQGDKPVKMLLRAIGPTLSSFGVLAPNPDPTLQIELRGESVQTIVVDDWSDTPELRAATAAIGTFSLPAGSKDSAIVVTIPPGSFNVLVRGKGLGGDVVIEAYQVPDPPVSN